MTSSEYIRFDQPNTGDSEINNRIQLAVNKFTDKSNLLQNMRINLKTRIKFLKSFVRSTLTHACQNWNINTNQMDRLDVLYLGFLRHMVRGGYRYINEMRTIIDIVSPMRNYLTFVGPQICRPLFVNNNEIMSDTLFECPYTDRSSHKCLQL